MAKDKEQSKPLDHVEQPKQEQALQRPAAHAAPVATKTADVSFDFIVAAIRDMSGKLTLPQRTAVIEALNAHLQPTPTPPSPYDGREFRFRVTHGGKDPVEVVAKSDREAWSMVCDAWKQWPSPKSGKVECLGEAAGTA